MDRPLMVSLAAGMLALSLASQVFAASTAAQRCVAEKLKAAGKAASAVVACYAKAAGKGTPLDVTCREKVLAKLAATFIRTEARGGCPAGGDLQLLDSFERYVASQFADIVVDEACDDGVDQDLDGLVDCFDSDCAYTAACAEDCTNGVDDNGNGAVDCFDYPYCVDAPACHETNCTNGIDDDGFGDIDCNDSDCVTEPACAESCTNGVDDNGNGAIDCLDYIYCYDAPVCHESSCTNGIDDDGFGDVDCDDYDCFGDPACNVCGNGIREGFESCDGADLGSASCTFFGFSGGTLRCLPWCVSFDLSGCLR